VPSGDDGTQQVSLYPRTRVAVLRESDILPDMVEAFDQLNEGFTAGETRGSPPAR
jgi:L-lactate utilization protein LutC